MSAPSPPPPNNNALRVSAYLGFIFFIAGLAMIFYVFTQANAMLSAPPPAVPKIVGTDPNGATNAGLALGASMRDLLQKLMILLVMCIAGSVFASYGIKFLFAAWNTKTSSSQ